MHVVIDGRLAGQRSGGIAVYTDQLCQALAAQPAEDLQLTIVYGRRGRPLLTTTTVRQRRARTPAHHRWETITFGLELLPLGADLIHAPDVVPPYLRRCPAVITVHDLAYLYWPEILDDDGRRHYGQIQLAIANAEHVIAVSQTTGRALIELLGLPAERLSVIAEAAGPEFGPVPAAERPAALTAAGANSTVRHLVLGQRGAYFLVVGTIEPRKNLPLLLRAYDRLVAAWPAAPRLVLAGRRGWLADETFTTLAGLAARSRVDWLDGPSTAELNLLYNGALALLFPSRYEGFGLPALEAMACGLPVLASDTSALREQVAGAGWLLPPEDLIAWSEAMAVIGQDGTRRAELAALGHQRTTRYAWAETARATLAVYRRVALDA